MVPVENAGGRLALPVVVDEDAEELSLPDNEMPAEEVPTEEDSAVEEEELEDSLLPEVSVVFAGPVLPAGRERLPGKAERNPS